MRGQRRSCSKLTDWHMCRDSVRVLLAWLCACLFWSTHVGAQSVVVIWTAADSALALETATRLRGEILAMGIAIARVEERVRLDQQKRQLGSLLTTTSTAQNSTQAVMEVTVSDLAVRIDVWLLDKLQQPSVKATLSEPKTTPNLAEKLAIRAAEVLHSHMLEWDLLPNKPLEREQRTSRQPVRDQPAESAPKPRAPQVGLALGAAMFAGTNGSSSAFVPRLHVEWPLLSRFRLNTSLAGLGSQSRVRTDQGTALIARHYALLGLSYQAEMTPFRPFVGLAIGAMLCFIEGHADAPLRSHDAARLLGLGELSVGTHMDLLSRYYVTLGGHMQATAPSVSVYVLEEAAATLGRPTWVVSLAFGAQL
jgi:hypothetical protein